MKNNSLNDLTKLGIQNFGFLMDLNSRITTREFGERIRAYSTDGRSHDIAFGFESISGILRRDHFGHKYQPEDAANRAEIVMRDLGWVAEQVDQGEYSQYKIVAKEPEADGSRREVPGLYDFQSQAYDEAAKTLKLRLRPDKAPLPHDPQVEAVFDLMRRVIEAPGALLQHYKNDFYEHDRNAIHAFAGQGKFIWVVKQSSTQLAPVGISRASSGFVEAAMNSGGGMPYEVYVIDGDKPTIKKIDREKALDILKHREYDITGSSVSKAGKLLATVSATMQSRVAEMPVGVVHVEPAANNTLTVRDLIALREIGVRQVTEKSGSLFTHTQEIVVGAERRPINEMIDLLRGFDKVSQSCFYGTIKCEKSDASLLESLGVKLAKYDDKYRTFSVAVPASSLKALESFQADFESNLVSLPYSIKPQDAIVSVISPEQMQPVERMAYGVYLNFAISRIHGSDQNAITTKYELPLLGAELRALMDANAAANEAKMSQKHSASEASPEIA